MQMVPLLIKCKTHDLGIISEELWHQCCLEWCSIRKYNFRSKAEWQRHLKTRFLPAPRVVRWPTEMYDTCTHHLYFFLICAKVPCPVRILCAPSICITVFAGMPCSIRKVVGQRAGTKDSAEQETREGELQNSEIRWRMKVAKSQFAATCWEIQAYCAHRSRQKESTLGVGTCFEQTCAEIGVYLDSMEAA